MRRLAVVALLAGCHAIPTAPAPVYSVSHAFVADTGALCKLGFHITTNAQAGASFTILLDSFSSPYPPPFTVQFRQDTDVTFTPQRPTPYWAFWNLYFTVPGTAVIVTSTDSALIAAPPAC